MGQIFHLTERSAWVAAQQAGEYRISTRGQLLDEVGFVHCALVHQLAGVAERYYGDLSDDELVVLVLDETAIPASVIYESVVPDGERFPHVYGPLPLDSVLRATPVQRDEAGRLVMPH
jgi:uncharacterized protein (DUF952 family)